MSYGYFDSNGADFPFTSGIVLTTGRLSEVPGPNISAGGNSGVLRAGTNDGLRDYDLENAIGISNTHNTTYIEFEFTAQTNHISFNYLLLPSSTCPPLHPQINVVLPMDLLF